MNTLELASNEVHVADIRTCVLHPASETHRQLTDEQLVAAGIESGMIREVIYVQRNAKKETSLACGGNVSDPSSGNFRGIGSVWGR